MDRHVGTVSITTREPNPFVLKVYRAGSVKETILVSINLAKTEELVASIKTKHQDMYVIAHIPARVSTAKR